MNVRERRLKELCSWSFVIIILVCGIATNPQTLYAAKDKESSSNGFAYDSDYSIKWCKEPYKFNVYTGKTKKPKYIIAGVKLYIGRARFKTKDKSYIDTFMVKTRVSPRDGIKKGKSKTGYKYKYKTYGVCRSLSIKSDLPGDMMSYSPDSQPQSAQYTVGVGTDISGKSASASISATTTIVNKALEFSFDDMNSAEDHFELVYKYNITYNPLKKKINKYLLNDNVQYATMTMKTKKKHYKIKFHVALKMGFASDKSGDAYSSIFLNSSTTGKETISIKY